MVKRAELTDGLSLLHNIEGFWFEFSDGPRSAALHVDTSKPGLIGSTINNVLANLINKYGVSILQPSERIIELEKELERLKNGQQKIKNASEPARSKDSKS